MQTWLVHMRSPRRLRRDLGWQGLFGFQLLLGGTVFASLVHPLVLGLFASQVLGGAPLVAAGGGLNTALICLYGVTLIGGYVASALLGATGLARRRLLSSAWWLPLVPLHWLLLSAAAWRALIQLMRDPHRWEKTAHGLARTSRLKEERRQRPERQVLDFSSVKRR
jgi:hypothetical protein